MLSSIALPSIEVNLVPFPSLKMNQKKKKNESDFQYFSMSSLTKQSYCLSLKSKVLLRKIPIVIWGRSHDNKPPFLALEEPLLLVNMVVHLSLAPG